MNKRTIICGLLLGACGCDSMNNTEKGMVGGGLIGTGFGAVIGSMFHRTGLGAAAGLVAGTAVGGLAGAKQDNREEKAKAQAMENARIIAQQNPPLALQDVVKMTFDHIPPDQIMRQIESTNSYYNLSVEDLTYLNQNGVSSQVIGFMQGRRRTSVVQAPVVVSGPPAGPVVVYERPYYPPPAVVIGGGYYRHW